MIVVGFILPTIAGLVFAVILFAGQPSSTGDGPSAATSPGLGPVRTIQLDLDGDARPTPSSVTARPDVSASEQTGVAGCSGKMSEVPQLVLHTSRRTAFSIFASATKDTTLVLETAPGEFLCDDDSRGLVDPQLDGVLSPGEHRLWVGTGGGEHAPIPATVNLRVANGTLDASADPTLGDIGGSGSQVWDGQVAATVDASQYQEGCPAFVSAAPQLRANLAAPAQLSITIDSSWDGLWGLLRNADGTFRCLSVSDDATLFDLAAGVSTFWIRLREADGGRALSSCRPPRGHDEVVLRPARRVPLHGRRVQLAASRALPEREPGWSCPPITTSAGWSGSRAG